MEQELPGSVGIVVLGRVLRLPRWNGSVDEPQFAASFVHETSLKLCAFPAHRFHFDPEQFDTCLHRLDDGVVELRPLVDGKSGHTSRV